jgi:hypothetical protein
VTGLGKDFVEFSHNDFTNSTSIYLVTLKLTVGVSVLVRSVLADKIGVIAVIGVSLATCAYAVYVRNVSLHRNGLSVCSDLTAGTSILFNTGLGASSVSNDFAVVPLVIELLSGFLEERLVTIYTVDVAKAALLLAGCSLGSNVFPLVCFLVAKLGNFGKKHFLTTVGASELSFAAAILSGILGDLNKSVVVLIKSHIVAVSTLTALAVLNHLVAGSRDNSLADYNATTLVLAGNNDGTGSSTILRLCGYRLAGIVSCIGIAGNNV